MATVRSRRTGKKISLPMTDTAFQSALGNFQKGRAPFNECFNRLKAADRERLFEFLMA